jgi:coniferyl-aldehyde dehydrogenase
MSSIGARQRVPSDSTRSEPELRRLLAAQRSAFAERPPRYRERLDALRALERAVLKHQHDMAAAVWQDFGGRATEETVALELFPLLREIRHACGHLKRWMAPRRAQVEWQFWPAKARTEYEPLGVVGILSPWNYPFFLSLAPLTGVLAAGNHALVKPSELAPASAELIRSILSDLYPPEYVSVITGGAETAAELSRLPLDHLLFTGSARVGKLVMRAASENLVPVTLELGGKSPAVIHPEYPLEKAAKRILTGKLYNAGQTCVAPDYVLLPLGRRDDFVHAAQRAVARMYPTLVNNGDYTRIINVQQYRRLSGLVDDARRLGAEVIEIKQAGEVCDERNRVFPPTIVTSVHEDMAIMHEEIFGPVLPIVEYGSLDEAMAYVNARPHPLALYYFDDDQTRANDVVRRVAAGGMTVNDCLFHVGQTGLPFGGIGPSGMGRYHGFDGFQTFSHKKGVLFQGRWSPLAFLRPPYGERTRQILRFLLRT